MQSYTRGTPVEVLSPTGIHFTLPAPITPLRQAAKAEADAIAEQERLVAREAAEQAEAQQQAAEKVRARTHIGTRVGACIHVPQPS